MFSQTWKKYLPIIKILMKRSASGHQTLAMNRTDFERAAGGRKTKLTFNLAFQKSRIQNISNPLPIARELATILQEDEMTRQLIRQQDYEFTMNSSYQLLIKSSAAPAEPVMETEAKEDSSE